MGDYYQYNKDKGLVTVDVSTLKQDVQDEFKGALGADLDLSPQTPQGRLIDAETLARSGVLGYVAKVSNQINPEESGGVFLASIFSLMGGSPFKAVPTTVFGVRAYGTQNSSIPAGMRVYDGKGNYFKVTTSVPATIADSSVNPVEYYGLVTLQAEIGGPTVITLNESWHLADPAPANVTRVTNPGSTTKVGAIKESDVAARVRRRDILAAQSSNTVRAARAKVGDLAGFRSMTIRENPLAVQNTIDGIVMPPNGFYVCVQGAVDEDISEALLEAKGCGCKFTPGISSGPPEFGTPVTAQLVEEASGQLYAVIHTRPETIDCSCELWYDIRQGYGNYDPEFSIQDAIARYQNGEMSGDPGMVIGRNLSAFELAGAVSYFYPGIYISGAVVSGKSLTNVQEIPAELWQVLEIPVGSIVINQGRP